MEIGKHYLVIAPRRGEEVPEITLCELTLGSKERDTKLVFNLLNVVTKEVVVSVCEIDADGEQEIPKI